MFFWLQECQKKRENTTYLTNFDDFQGHTKMRKSDALAISKWVKVLAAGHWAERTDRCVVIKQYSCSSSSSNNNNNNMNKNRNKKKKQKKKKKKKKTNEHKNATKRCVARWLQAAVWKEHHTVLCTCAHVQSTWTTLFHFCPYPSLRFYDHNSGDQAMTSAGTARWFCKRKWNRDCHITIQNQTPITLASGGLDTWFRKGNCQGIIEWPQALRIHITQRQAKHGDMIGQGGILRHPPPSSFVKTWQMNDSMIAFQLLSIRIPAINSFKRCHHLCALYPFSSLNNLSKYSTYTYVYGARVKTLAGDCRSLEMVRRCWHMALPCSCIK